MAVTIEPTVAADLAAVTDRPLPGRIRALTARRCGRVLGVGGFRFLPDGTVLAFLALTAEGRTTPVTLHRAGLRLMREAREAGYRRILAEADPAVAAAGRWLVRLGFRRIEDGEPSVYLWEG